MTGGCWWSRDMPPQIKDKFNLNFSLRMGNSIKLSFLCLGALCVLRMKWTMKQRGGESLQLGLGLLELSGLWAVAPPWLRSMETSQTKQPQQRASEPQREREQIDETKREGKSMKLIMEWNGIIYWMIAATSLFVESICGWAVRRRTKRSKRNWVEWVKWNSSQFIAERVMGRRPVFFHFTQ